MAPVPIEAFDLLPRGVVQRLDTRGFEPRGEAAVQEDRIVDHGGDGLVPQPSAVASVGLHRLPVLDETRRVRTHPRVAGHRLRVSGAVPVPPPPGRVGRVLPVGVFAPPLRVVRREGGEDRRRDVPDVGHQVHRFVIAEQHPDLAAVLPGAVLEPHQEVHDRAHLGTPVGEVAGLNQGGGPAGPVAFGVDQAGPLQDLVQLVAGAVDVADRDHPAGSGPGLGRGGRAAGREQQEERRRRTRAAVETGAPVRRERGRGRGASDGLHESPQPRAQAPAP